MSTRTIRDRADPAHPYYAPQNDAARTMIRKRCRELAGNLPAVAAALDLPRTTFYREVHRLGLAVELGVTELA